MLFTDATQYSNCKIFFLYIFRYVQCVELCDKGRQYDDGYANKHVRVAVTIHII